MWIIAIRYPDRPAFYQEHRVYTRFGLKRALQDLFYGGHVSGCGPVLREDGQIVRPKLRTRKIYGEIV